MLSCILSINKFVNFGSSHSYNLLAGCGGIFSLNHLGNVFVYESTKLWLCVYLDAVGVGIDWINNSTKNHVASEYFNLIISNYSSFIFK